MAAALCAGLAPSAFAAEEKTDKLADPATYNDYNDMLGDAESTRYNGRVWSDKTVSEDSITFTATGDDELQDAEGESIGKKYTVNTDASKGEDFLVTFSTLATSMEVTDSQDTPVDVLFVLDLSQSMNWATDSEQVYIPAGATQPDAASAQKNSRLQALVDSLNDTIDALARANSHNRVGIVTFNATASTLYALDTVQTRENKDYLTIKSFTIDDHEKPDDKWEASAKVQCNMRNVEGSGKTVSASTGSGTNVQSGLYLGMTALTGTNNQTTVEINGTTVTRKPFVVLMSDGAPTTFSSASDASWTADGNNGETGVTIQYNKTDMKNLSNITAQSGSWWDALQYGTSIGRGDSTHPDSADGFMAILTAAYMKKAITEKYYPDGSEDATVYTVGFSTKYQSDAMQLMVGMVLDPETGVSQDAVNALNDENDRTAITELQAALTQYVADEDTTQAGSASVEAAAYTVSDADAETAAEEIATAETATGETAAHEMTGSVEQPAMFSANGIETYAAGNDTKVSAHLGDQDSKSAKATYIVQHPDNENDPATLEELYYPDEVYAAESSEGLSEAFDKILTNITNTPAQVPTQVGYDPVESGYITYTDSIGEYMAVKDVKTLIYSGKVFTERTKTTEDNVTTYTFSGEIDSPIYQAQNANEIEIKVTTNPDDSQTVTIRVPAAAIPVRVNTVTVENGQVQSNVSNHVYPLRVVYSVGTVDGALETLKKLRSEADDSKVTYTLYAGRYSGQVLKKSDNKVYSLAGDMEPEEYLELGDATVTFQPATRNPFYFIQEDTPLYADAQCANPLDHEVAAEDTYYFQIQYYEGNAVKTAVIARSGSLLSGYTVEKGGSYYLKAGSPRLGNLSELATKKVGSSLVNTSYVLATAATRENDTAPWIMTSYLGNNGSLALGETAEEKPEETPEPEKTPKPDNSPSTTPAPTATPAPATTSPTATPSPAPQAVIPQTGDASHPEVWAVLLCLSAVGVITLGVWRKRKQ